MTSLKADIVALRQDLAGTVPEDVRKILQRTTQRLVDSDIAKEAAGVGDVFPRFALPNAGGIAVSSEDLLAEGPLVVSFFRGGWCPYCSLELRAYQRILAEIHQAGAELVAISPQLPDESLIMAAKTSLTFEVLTDTGNSLAEHLGLSFLLPDPVIDIYRSIGIDLEQINGVMRWTLPIPATYVLNQDSIIVEAFVNADHSHRMEPMDMLAALREL